ncbi:MAG: hypothetical protein IPL27_02355 [Lewinellaceae bacterium]|nr:hypothetical protein [Lewinellaceae bacterium]
MRDSINNLKEKFFQHKEVKGIQRNPDVLTARFRKAIGYIYGGQGVPNATAQIAVTEAKREAEALIEQVNTLFDTPWKTYRAKAETVRYSLFKDF